MESRKNFVIGIAGSVGSGCTEISKILEKKDFQRLSLSSLIKRKFKEIHCKEPTFGDFGEDWRLELQNIGNYGREGKYSPNNNGDNKGYWIELALKNTEDNLRGDLVIDGIRNRGEVEFLRDAFPQTQFWLIAVYADYETRYQRVKTKYPNENIFERDDKRDSNEEDEPFGQNVELCVRDADYVFNNNKKLAPEDYRHKTISKKILEDIDVMKKRKVRQPRMPEVFMATAVSQSHASQCIKRKVGALIVDEENKIPISVGYNDNPIGYGIML